VPRGTDNLVALDILYDLGIRTNPLRGVKGQFYTTNRETDLLSVIAELIGE
jgi:hypothetical protein